MNDELKDVIIELYEKFSIYPLKAAFDGCPCCISDSEKLTLHTKPLNGLNSNDLESYAASAMLTWGDDKDFKHFLPRIFDLLSSGILLTDTFIILGKLELSKWNEWDVEEQELIKRFLIEWWTDLTQNKAGFEYEAFMEISKRLNNVQQLLDKWKITFINNSFKNLIEFIYYNLNELNTQKRLFTYKNISADTINKINKWVIGQVDKVEQGYFRYENEDKVFAEKISVSYEMIRELKKSIN